MTLYLFFFQAEDGIRDTSVTGVQTCALPILGIKLKAGPPGPTDQDIPPEVTPEGPVQGPKRQEIGRASCRERV